LKNLLIQSGDGASPKWGLRADVLPGAFDHHEFGL
jgi:hypothetical protein